jgi:nucleotide-binding universal stress UspA family protein
MIAITPRTFSHLLVPLDGSHLAEAVLPIVETLAKRFQARVTLIHVLEERPPATVHGERHLADATEAAVYLKEVAARLQSAGLAVETHVHDAPEGDLAGSLIAHADEYAPDLVVLCAHGRGGLRGLLYGGIAQQVLKRGMRPVLLIHPTKEGGAPAFDLRRILVPLDDRHAPEMALDAAAEMAKSFGAGLDLLFVVPTLETLSGERAATGVLLPATTRAILDMDQQGAEDYLAQVAGQCRAEGLTVTAEVLRGDVVPSVLDQAELLNSDLIVMVSHGRAGLDALLSGSVTPRIAARADRPLLLVRMEEQRTEER